MYRAIVVDDEPAAAHKLADLLRASGKFAHVDAFTNPLEALDHAGGVRYHAAFLDIEMPGIDGLTLADRMLDFQRGIKIIFVTAYNQYAVEAFELEALDYLLKPVTKERMLKALNRLPELGRDQESYADEVLKVYCFGKFRVETPDGTVFRWRTGKTEELFAYLVDKNGSWVAKDMLIEDIWHDYRGEQVAGYFSTCFYNLRKTLAATGFHDLVQKTNSMYRVDISRVHTDIGQFEKQLSEETVMNEHTLYVMEATLEQASAGYLSGNYYDWAEEKRRQLEHACVQQSIKLADYCSSTGRERRAAELLRRGLSIDPTHTGLNIALLQLYEKLNDPVAVRKHYEKYKRLMIEDYGLEPDSRMEQFIRRSGQP